MSKNVNITLADEKGISPLHAAALWDTEGKFLQDLIDAKADVNIDTHQGKTPLSCAIAVRNLKAVEILLKAGAKINENNYKDLEDPIYTSLHVFIPPEMKKGALDDIYEWIQKGHCVVLHYHGYNGMMYYYPNASHRTSKLIYVDINPETQVLDHEEGWPFYLRKAGYEYGAYDIQKVKEAGFLAMFQYRFPV